jgi:aspartate kinase
MKIKVMKFGGTSVAGSEARAECAKRVISAKEQGYRPIVVVSAIGRKGAPYSTDSLIKLLTDIDPTVAPDPRELDLMIACGEILSASILAHTLKTMGHSAMSFRGGQAGIRTDGVYGNARIKDIDPRAVLKALSNGAIPVICGFQGTYQTPDKLPGAELTTLGRGGSDTTAAAIGAGLKPYADEVIVEIFTDVDGVKTADPDCVKNAPTLRKVTYDEVAEIAHLGAKVVHPRAAEIAMQFDIPLWVKNTFSDDEGTEIVPAERFPGRRVTGVTHTGKLVYLQFDLTSAPEADRAFLESTLFGLMAQNSLNLYMLTLSPSGTGFAVPRDQFPVVMGLLNGLVIPAGTGPLYLLQIGTEPSREVETQADLMRPLGETRRITAELTEGCSMVSLVGHEYMQQPGVYLDVLEALFQGQIPILQTCDSEFSLSCLVPESEANRAVRLLHERFELAKTV